LINIEQGGLEVVVESIQLDEPDLIEVCVGGDAVLGGLVEE